MKRHNDDNSNQLAKIIKMEEYNRVDTPIDEGKHMSKTFLFLAAKEGNTKEVKNLIERGADFKSPLTEGDEEGLTPLFVAASNGHEGVVNMLIERGADFKSHLTEGDEEGFTPLFVAASNGHEGVVNMLIERGADFKSHLTEGDEEGLTPLFVAASNGHEGVVNMLIERGADFKSHLTEGDEEGFTPLYTAALNGHEGVVNMLIERGADFKSPLTEGDWENCTPLYAAASNGHEGVVNMLIERGADFKSPLTEGDWRGCTPLYAAALNRHEGVVNMLIERGADFKSPLTEGDWRGCTPLYTAASNGHEGVVNMLIERGADFKSPLTEGDEEGFTPLYTAASNGHEGVVKVLVIEGARRGDYYPATNDAIKNILNVADDFNKITQLIKLPKEELSGRYDTPENIGFALEIFNKALTKNINQTSFEDFKDILHLYNNLLPVDLLNSMQSEVFKKAQEYNEYIGIIEGQLFEYTEEISPLPINVFLANQENKGGIPTTESAVRETKLYQNFMNSPKNQKYKVAGTKLKEMLSAKSENDLSLVASLMLKGMIMNDIALNEITKNLLLLNSTYLLPKEIKQLLATAVSQYNKYKDDPLMKASILQENIITQQHEEIEELKNKVGQQEKEIGLFKNILSKFASHIGINLDQLLQNANDHSEVANDSMKVVGEDSIELTGNVTQDLPETI